MPRPSIPNIRFPKEESQLSRLNDDAKGDGKCGASWNVTFDLVRPFGNTNNYSKRLKRLAKSEELQMLPSPDLIARVEDAIDDAREDLSHYRSERALSRDDRDKIDKYFDRAENYLSIAQKLDRYWAEEYMPPNMRWKNPPKAGRPIWLGGIDLSHWPLWDDAPWRGACGFLMAKSGQEVAVGFPVGGLKYEDVLFTCPSMETVGQHSEDKVTYGDLLTAAVRNARCAQELLYSVAFYNLNKKDAPPVPKRTMKVVKKAQLIPGVAAAPVGVMPIPEVPPGVSVIPLPTPEYEPEPEVEEPEDIEEPKKDNKGAILALGAAAVVLLALSKK